MARWVRAGATESIPEHGLREAEAGAVAVLLRLGGTIYATSAICPHHAAWLSESQVIGNMIACPRHMGRFHIVTGRKLHGPACPDLRTYPVRVVDDWLEVDVG